MSPQEGISLNFNKHVFPWIILNFFQLLLPWGFGRSSRNLHEEIFRTWALTQGFIFSLGTLLFVCLGTWYTKGVVTCSTFHTARCRNMTGMQPMEGNKWRIITRKRMKWCSMFSGTFPYFLRTRLDTRRLSYWKMSESLLQNSASKSEIIANPKMLTMPCFPSTASSKLKHVYTVNKLDNIYIYTSFPLPTKMDLQKVDFWCCSCLIPGEYQILS